MFESEIFGHVRGAFTGADSAKQGYFRQAQGGTLLLDEIGDLPHEKQPVLLRALQQRMVHPVGADRDVAVDARIVAATNRDLERLVADGRFREDLYYRLNEVHIQLPTLDERRLDIPDLVANILAALDGDDPATEIAADALAYLTERTWPGNLRELVAVLRCAHHTARGGAILRCDVAPAATAPSAPPAPPAPLPVSASSWAQLEGLYRQLLVDGLRETAGNQSELARLLGLKRSTLRDRLKAHGLL